MLPNPRGLGFGNKVIVLLGDSVKDVTMVEGLAEEDVPLAVLRIGLLNTTTGDSLSEDLMEHMAAYDAVIAGDGPLDFAITYVLGQLWNWDRPPVHSLDQESRPEAAGVMPRI